jgi:hypothetical protein
LVLFSIFWLRFHGTLFGNVLADWNFVGWFQALVVELAILLCGVVWYAPIAAWFLMLSAWARKLVFLWAIVPLAALPALEGVFFQSRHVLILSGVAFLGFVPAMHLDQSAFNMGNHGVAAPRIGEVLAAVDVPGVLLSSEAWLGMAAGGGHDFRNHPHSKVSRRFLNGVAAGWIHPTRRTFTTD